MATMMKQTKVKATDLLMPSIKSKTSKTLM